MQGLNVMMVMQVRGQVVHVGQYSMTMRGLSQWEVVFSREQFYNSISEYLDRNVSVSTHSVLRKALRNDRRIIHHELYHEHI